MFIRETRLGEGNGRYKLRVKTPSRSRKGLVLTVVIIIAVIFAIIGMAILTLAEQEVILTRIEADKARAFYLAEAGLGKLSETLQTPLVGNLNEVIEGSIDQDTYRVVIDMNQTPCYVVSTGTSGVVQKKVRVQASFLAAPFDNAIFAMNNSGGSWAFQLRGTGNPVASGSGEKGGKDIVNGNIFVDGDAFLYEQSSINAAPAPNKWGLHGDAEATGNISVLGSSHVSGATTPNTEEPPPIDITAMNYAVNNTNNVAQIFQDAGVTTGHLPNGNPLRDIFVKNPSSMSSECSDTVGDDYFIEPSTGGVGGGTQKDATTPVHLGNNRVYYVDGDVWVHNTATYGFLVDGKVTIVTTGDIHICDNIKYKDANSLLGLVALGKYDSSGERVSGGNIFFGDPRYGTMYTTSAMMFAANNFYYNTDAISRAAAEPTTGFTVNGCFAAMNKVQIDRDWYDQTTTTTTTKNGKTKTTTTTEARAAHYDSTAGRWIDAKTGTVLTSTETGTMRHYQMIVNYDDRVRSTATQPPGLPRGTGKIFMGFSNWEEL
jgi:hypothetical protein